MGPCGAGGRPSSCWREELIWDFEFNIFRFTFLRLRFLLAAAAAAARGGGGVPPAVDGAAVDEVGLLPVGEKSEFGSFLFYFRLTFLRLRFLLAGGCLGAGLGELGESGSAGLNSSGSLVPSPFFLLPFKGSNPSESWPSGPSEAPWTRLRPPRMLLCPSEPVLRRSASVVGPGEGKKDRFPCPCSIFPFAF